jgi:diacylglycerol kinase family enzyme
MVIVGGGDGTLSTTIDFFKDRDTVFALLPLGTANSFARTLGIPLDLPGAVDVIAKGMPRRIDLGCVNGDYFANTAAIGLSPMIARTVPHKLKKYLGRVGYGLWAAKVGVGFRPFRLTIDYAQAHASVWATEVRIANGGYFGGVELVVDEDGGVLIRIASKPVYFTVGDEQESIQAHTAWTTNDTTRPSADKMNDWNRTKRYSKVYVDNDRDPVLQLDLDLAGGVTVARIKDFAFTTQVSITRFTAEVLK